MTAKVFQAGETVRLLRADATPEEREESLQHFLSTGRDLTRAVNYVLTEADADHINNVGHDAWAEQKR